MEVYSQLEMKLQEDLDELRRGQYLQGVAQVNAYFFSRLYA